jgi:hypothetical protein
VINVNEAWRVAGLVREKALHGADQCMTLRVGGRGTLGIIMLRETVET